MKRLIAAALFVASPALAGDVVSYDTEQSFDDVIFGLESAIIDEGLVVDHVSHTGEMLERTRGDVGSEVVLFDAADVYSFCSAALSRAVMEADPMNIGYCPYTIFVMVRHDAPTTTTIGFRAYPEGEMQQIQELLDRIARSAIGQD